MKNLLFSSANEDGRAERDALHLTAQDNVLCVCGSGSRPLELLLAKPKRIVVVDWSFEQLALAQLKFKAIAHLDAFDALRFLGVLPSGISRYATFETLACHLDARTAAFWRSERQAIESGVIYSGRWERMFRVLSLAARPFLGKHIDRLFGSTNLDEQADAWRQVKQSPWWRAAMRTLSARAFWRLVMREPGIQYVPRAIDLGQLFEQYLDEAMHRRLVHSSPFAWIMFYGAYSQVGPWPDHLLADNLAICSRALQTTSVEMNHAPLVEFLNDSNERFSAFSLSDISSYASKEDHSAIWRGVLHCAKSDAKFCERLFLGYREMPTLHEGAVQRNLAVESSLAASDSSFIYKFAVGIVSTNRRTMGVEVAGASG